MRHTISIAANVLILLATTAQAKSAGELLAQFKAASGAARWDAVTSLRQTGTLHAGGLDGEFQSLQDVSTGRSVGHYTLGSIQGAEGYDGHAGWSRDPGGEVAVQDAPDAVRHARSQAWLDARAFWYPQRMPAQWGIAQARTLEGRSYEVVSATPVGGDAITLWFDASTHLLTRVVQPENGGMATTVCDDWREAHGLRLPFHCVTDRTDTAGRTDARARTEIRLASIDLNPAIADADFAVPAMPVTAHIDNSAGITHVAFELWSNHIYVQGSIDGKPARFLVDTGGMNLLTPQAAKKFGIHGEGKLLGRGVGEHSVDVALAHAQQVRVGDAVLDKPVFLIMDLGALSAVEGVECDGLVGYEMFRRFGITIDYANRQLILADPSKFVPPANAHETPFQLADRMPIIQGNLDGVPARISIDTGSRSSLTVHAPFAHAHHLVEKYHAAADAVAGWGVGGASRARPARFGTLSVANLSVNDIAGDIYTGDKGSFAAPDISANLGGGVLRRFTVAFDYSAKKMYLAPNAAFATPDEFDRSGLWLLGAGDALEIADVAADSAAQRAGLKTGDRLVAIDGEKIASRRLPEWRQRLRHLPVGTKLAIEYLREGHAQMTTLRLTDRIPARWKP